MAEGVGFEPTVPCGTTVFKTVTIDHSDTPPRVKLSGRQPYKSSHLPVTTVSCLLPIPVFVSVQRLPDFLGQGRLLWWHQAQHPRALTHR